MTCVCNGVFLLLSVLQVYNRSRSYTESGRFCEGFHVGIQCRGAHTHMCTYNLYSYNFMMFHSLLGCSRTGTVGWPLYWFLWNPWRYAPHFTPACVHARTHTHTHTHTHIHTHTIAAIAGSLDKEGFILINWMSELGNYKNTKYINLSEVKMDINEYALTEY